MKMRLVRVAQPVARWRFFGAFTLGAVAQQPATPPPAAVGRARSRAPLRRLAFDRTSGRQ